jgi:tRNA(fMet)-specific endonuclease VapC
MGYLLDTCAISQTYGKEGETKVVDFLLAIPREDLFLSAVTVGEIQRGAEGAKSSRDREDLNRWLAESILNVFADQILPFDTETAIEWGMLRVRLAKAGTTMQILDSLIAATALVHSLTVVTRNVADFSHARVRIFNPWK